MATNGLASQQELNRAPEQGVTPGAEQASANQGTANRDNGLPKDEVGWYFVEQYYNTLSKSPERLHLYYGKASQFVYGLEAEVSNVSVGRQAIQARIQALNLEDRKVRISNVDAQASVDNIFIQVIGQFSDKGAEPVKFVQSFVLAQQPSGYFVLNDVLRYLDDDDNRESESDEDAENVEEPAHGAETEVQGHEQEQEATPTTRSVAVPDDVPEPAPTAAEPEAAKELAPDEPKLDTKAVDEKLNEAAFVETPAPVNGEGSESSTHPTGLSRSEHVAEPQITFVDASAEPDKPEKSKEPKEPNKEPATVAEAKNKQEAAPEPALPPKPMTWASRAAAAAAAGPRPVVPLQKAAPAPAPAPAQSLNRASATDSTPGPAAASASSPVPAPDAASAPASVNPGAAAMVTTPKPPSAAPSATPSAANVQSAAQAQSDVSNPGAAPTTEAMPREASGWQTADSKRQHRPQPSTNNNAEKENTLIYVRFVTSKVQEADLRSTLASYGELSYFDINRSKNCAFAEYKTIEGFRAAVASSPQVVSGVEVVTEPRRPPKTPYNYNPNYANTPRINSPGGRGRGGFDGGRGNQGAQRGNFHGQRGGTARGRGNLQSSNA